MDLTALRKKIGTTEAKLNKLDDEAKLAAPVDVEAMFQHGVVVATAPNHETKKGTLIDGHVATKIWKIGAPVWVTGDVTADRIELTSDLVVEGSLTVTGDVHGKWEPNTLTVLGKVTLARAIMEGQFIMQFLGGGTIAELVNDEGGAEELIELMSEAGSKLKVKKKSDKLPNK
jgi:hypothetical protein